MSAKRKKLKQVQPAACMRYRATILDLNPEASVFSFRSSACALMSAVFRLLNPLSAVLLAAFVLMSACGYRFSGGGNLPGGIQRVFISQFDNRTSETGLENAITGDLRYEFIRYKRNATPDGADAVLSGTVKSLRVETISRSGQHSSLERRVTLSLDLKLTDRSGRVVWSVGGLADSETYRVESSSQATDANRRRALAALSKRLAENIYYRLTEDF